MSVDTKHAQVSGLMGTYTLQGWCNIRKWARDMKSSLKDSTVVLVLITALKEKPGSSSPKTSVRHNDY